MAKSKCAHPPCTCKVTGDEYGDYCSEFCRQAGTTSVEIFCECLHPGCRGVHP